MLASVQAVEFETREVCAACLPWTAYRDRTYRQGRDVPVPPSVDAPPAHLITRFTGEEGVEIAVQDCTGRQPRETEGGPASSRDTRTASPADHGCCGPRRFASTS